MNVKRTGNGLICAPSADRQHAKSRLRLHKRLIHIYLAMVCLLALQTVAAGQAVSLHHCYDGDTCTFLVDGEKVKVRILGIDAPEMKGRCPAETDLAIKARDRLLELLRGAGSIELVGEKKDKYRRRLAKVLADGEDVGPVLVREKLARPYKGRRRDKWC